ncbi:coiled-coil domain-containing protein 166-like [Python bivittatus]|uniref:Coiled-coil domain-containing protein 166-like n=1 Tax=Python bivittatus TaxID=176946 RepID=A0A9F2WMC9_PYTBI|nr:coiled-coil domain-containing protein 166-like [Python bivittatus]
MTQKKTKSRIKKSIAKEQSTSGQFISEREQYLQKEYATLTEHIKTYSDRVDHFQDENEFLDKEAQEIRENNKAYLAYLAKRTLWCQNAIITLNDQNRSDLAYVLKQKDELTSQYTDKEKEVRSQLIEMETKYSLMNKEIDELRPFKELQSEQLAHIRELEKVLLVMKIHHSEQMHKVKSQFLQQKAEYEMESQQRVQALAKKAEKEAVRSLIQHTKQIKAENWRLRNELMNLIKRAQGLKAIVHQLQEQNEQLLRELQYGKDLAHMHRWLTQQKRSRCKTGLSTRTKLGVALQPLMNKSPESPTSIQVAAEKQSTTQKTSVGETIMLPGTKFP